ASSLLPYGPHPDLPSFPTRRSSDLPSREGSDRVVATGISVSLDLLELTGLLRQRDFRRQALHRGCAVEAMAVRRVLHDEFGVVRSEEHTSELQSRENLVCRLLLEKK